MNEIPLDHLLDTAICAAEAAGNHALNNKDRRSESTEVFSHDVKLVLDQECQKMAEDVIASEFPDHAILGEEGCTPKANAPYEWVIDPIDGTMNYSHGFHYWCSSVAVRQGQTVLAGCVFAPEFNTYYTAHLQQPAKMNGLEIQVSGTQRLQQAMVFSGLSSQLDESGNTHFDLFQSLALNTKKIRINGAAALDLCQLADGTCDGVLHMGINLWDYAAAGLIAERAGAQLKVYSQNIPHQGCTVLSANDHLIEGLRNLYTQHI